MPHLNFNKVTGYESFLNSESYKNKLKFLKSTVYNIKQIKKTLDLRKFSELEKGQLKRWRAMPNQMIR